MLSSIPLTGLGWIELTYSGGDPYGSHCGKAGRVSRIFFFCDSAAGDVSGCCMWDIWLVCSLSNSVIRICVVIMCLRQMSSWDPLRMDHSLHCPLI